MSLCRHDGRPAQALDTEKIAPQFSTASLREAFKMLDYAERNSVGYDHALALFKYGDVLLSLCEFRKPENYLKESLAALDGIIKTEKSKASSDAPSLEKLNPQGGLWPQPKRMPNNYKGFQHRTLEVRV